MTMEFKMADYIHQEGGVRLEVWETNKGHSLGLFKWRVRVWNSEIEAWSTAIHNTYPQAYDKALSEGKYHYERESAKQQVRRDVFVTPEAKAELMREYGLTEADFYTEDNSNG